MLQCPSTFYGLKHGTQHASKNRQSRRLRRAGASTDARSASLAENIQAKARSLVEPYLTHAWRGAEDFVQKTRSSNVEKRALELAATIFANIQCRRSFGKLGANLQPKTQAPTTRRGL